MSDELKATLLGLRDHTQPCEHEPVIDQTGRDAGAYNFNGLFWLCGWDTWSNGEYLACPGGAAVAVECETCGGSGDIPDRAATEREYLEGLRQLLCPDCVDGIRILKGRIIEWCKTHDHEVLEPGECISGMNSRCYRIVSVWLLEDGEDQ